MLKKQPSVLNYYLLQKRTLLLFIIITIVSFLCSQIGRSSILINVSYSLHELVYGIANLIFLTPILFLFFVFFSVKYIQSSSQKFIHVRRIVPTFLLFATLLSIYTVSYYQLHDYTTAGILSIDFKTQEENKYYLWIDDTKISTSQEIYNMVEIKEEYDGSYLGNSLNSGKGKLLSINTLQ